MAALSPRLFPGKRNLFQVEETGFLQRFLAAPMPHSQCPSPIPPSASWGARGVGRRRWGGGNWAQVNPPLSL